MASLFIANPTKQNNHLYYRIPEVARLQDEVVPAGGQIQIAKHLNPTEAQLNGILSQLEASGCVPANEINKAKDKRFVLVYAWNNPVNVDKIAIALTKNDEVAQKVSDDQLVETASQAIDFVSRNAGVEPQSAEVKVIETTQDRKGKKSREVRTVSL